MLKMLRVALFAALGGLVVSSNSVASGGWDGYAALVPVSQIQPEPDALPGFLDGHLGILWPHYDRAFLMMAYRQSAGLQALSDADKTSLLAKQGLQEAEDISKTQQLWLDARKHAGAADLAEKLSAGWRSSAEYRYDSNCQANAYTMAAQTLKNRLRDRAAEGDWIKQWVAAQDSVFSTCDSQQKQIAMPILAAGAPVWLVKDRAYQQAAALFYKEQFNEARAAFDAIASDTASPWQEWASYLSVRSWWRNNFNLSPDDEPVEEGAQQPMIIRLKHVATTAQDPAVKNAAQNLYEFFTSKEAPKESFTAHWQRMDAKEPVAELAAWISDERWFWALLKEEDYRDSWLYLTRWGGANGDSGDDFTKAETRLFALSKMQKNPIWLASALMLASPETPGVSEMIAASKKSKPGEPLYIHFAWQRARLAIAQRNLVAARAELAAVNNVLANESLGTRQAFDQLEMLLSPSLDTLAQHLQRTAVGEDTLEADGGDRFSANLTSQDREKLLDNETRQWLSNQLSGQELLILAQDTRLSPTIRLQLVGEAWFEGAFLADMALEQAAMQLRAELTNNAQLATAATQPTLDEARFMMARTLLLNGVVRVQKGFNGAVARGFALSERISKRTSHWDVPPVFHDAKAQKLQAERLKKLAAGNETTWMGKQILPWMQSHPRFTEGPALLEKLVNISRYGMNDTATSRQAFILLHKQYPNSPEAIRTKYFH